MEKYILLQKLDDIKNCYPDLPIPHVDIDDTEEIRSVFITTDRLVKEKEEFRLFRNYGYVLLYSLKNLYEKTDQPTEKINKLLFGLTQVTKIEEIQELIRTNLTLEDINKISADDIGLLIFASTIGI